MPSVGLLAIGLAMVFCAGLIRGFSGFGLSIAAVPLLSLIAPPVEVIPIVLLLQLFVSLSGLRAAAAICDWRSIRILSVGALVATPLGAWALTHLPAAPVRLAIAAIVIGAVIILSRGFRMQIAPSGGRTLPFGIISGLFNGLAGMPGPPVIAFYLAAPLGHDVARASMILFFLATSVFALVPLAMFGDVGAPSLIAAAMGFPVVLFGSMLGTKLYRISPEAHYRLVAIVLLIVAAALAAIRAAYDFTA